MIATLCALFVWFDEPLPWPLPIWPYIESVVVDVLSLDSLEHGAGYADQLADTQDSVNELVDPIDDLSTIGSSWFAEMPDTSGEDFDTGMDPITDVYGTAGEFGTDLGTSIGVLFDWARSLASVDGIGPLALWIFACTCWFILLNLIIFGVQIFDAVWTFAAQAAQVIADYFVPW